MNAWVDANVLLRFITGDPPALARRARALMKKAEAGQLRLRLSPLVVAETVWVLDSFYGFQHPKIRDALSALITAAGVDAQETDVLLGALHTMAEANVDFVDAYLAETARARNEPVCSFDTDFKRLGAETLAR